MKLLAPIAVIIAAASAGRVFSNPIVENYVNSAENYQSELEFQQRGLYSGQSEAQTGYQQTANYRPEGEKLSKILAYVNENSGHGQYHYGYETDNGIKAEEEGEIHHDKGTSAHGTYSYKSDDGQVYSVSYTADENGFRPSGAHLPTPPPIPVEIQKSLEQNAKDEAAGIYDDGSYREHQQQNQYQSGHQAVGYQSTAQSGADLAYHALAPFYNSGQKLQQQKSIHGPSSGYQGSGYQIATFQSAGHQNTGYQMTSGQAEDNLAYFAPSHNANLENQVSLSHDAYSDNQASLGQEAYSGQIAVNQGTYSGHQNLGHEVYSSHQATLGHDPNLAHQVSHVRQKESIVYGAPKREEAADVHVMNMQHGLHGSLERTRGNPSYAGLSYLPPSINGGYQGYQ